MGIGGDRTGTRSAQFDEKEEAVILRSCDEEGRRLSEEADHAHEFPGARKQGRPKM